MAGSDFGWQRSELGYCSNVHPGATLAQVEAAIAGPIAAVRRLRGHDRIGSGLWLGHGAARELTDDRCARDRFAALLADSGVELFTLNGFPYDDFHAGEVKAAVYQPDWSDRRRLDYTLMLAELLAALLPAGRDLGTISTLPLGFAPGWDNARQRQALDQLCDAVRQLAALRERSGRQIRLCLEMEPGCVLERSEQAIGLFREQLPAAARATGIPQTLIDDHLGLCYDVCHQAVLFEPAGATFDALCDAGIAIGKVQISSALQLTDPADRGRELLQAFAEPRYLHQLYTLDAQGKPVGLLDLPELAHRPDFPHHQPWRVHFHLPIQADTLYDPRLQTTRNEIGVLLDRLLQRSDQRPHLEVETYTWQVLPEPLRPTDDTALQRGLAAELDWLEQQLDQRGLLCPESAV